MDLRTWIKAAQRSGWRVDYTAGTEIHLRCCAIGCPGRLTVALNALEQATEPCALEHREGMGRPVWDDYYGLVDELRRRRRALGLDQADVCNAMGMADGYVAKLESGARIPRPHTLQLWAQTLGLRLTTTPDKLPAATLKAIEDRRARPYAASQARFKNRGEQDDFANSA